MSRAKLHRLLGQIAQDIVLSFKIFEGRFNFWQNLVAGYFSGDGNDNIVGGVMRVIIIHDPLAADPVEQRSEPDDRKAVGMFLKNGLQYQLAQLMVRLVAAPTHL